MANLNMAFDANSVEPGRSDFEPIPPGEYLAQIVESDVVTPKSGKGMMLKLRFDILDGAYANRVIFCQINYQHENPTAQLIGQQLLKSICDAIGFEGALEDSSDLHFRPMKIVVKVRQDKTGQYGPQNEVRAAKPVAASAPPAGKAQAAAATTPHRASQTAATAPRPAPAAGQARPWGNRASP